MGHERAIHSLSSDPIAHVRSLRNLSSEAALSNALPGDNRTQWGCWTRRIFPVSARDINASVRADN
jgi:hypothetical protein